MATGKPIPNCIQVRLVWSTPSRTLMNVVHGFSQSAGPLNPNIAQSFFSALTGAAGWPNVLAQLPTSTTLTAVDVRDLRQTNNPLIAATFTAIPGTSASTPLPPQTAIAITLRTAFAGVQFRGRIYWGGLSLTADDTTGHISTPGSNAAMSYYNSITAGMNAIAWPLSVAGRDLPARPGHGGVTLPPRPAQNTLVTSALVRDNIFDTQRRRTGAHIGSR